MVDELPRDAGVWVAQRLGAEPVAAPVRVPTDPWSRVWRIATAGGDFWMKECGPGHAGEGRVHAAIAAVAPAHVDAPIAVDVRHRWILMRDGGPTLLASEPGTRGIEVDTLTRLLTGYADLQLLALDHRGALVEAGVPVFDPRDAAGVAESQSDYLAALPVEDPRHLPEEHRRRVLAALPDLVTAGAALAGGPVPCTFDQGDLWPNNVFRPGPDGHFRIFDFADAVWTHPFVSLVMLVWECIFRWEVPQPDDAVDLREERIRAVFDAYLCRWTDFAPLPRLRELAGHALRIAPLLRTRAWIRNLDSISAEARSPFGNKPWAYLEDVTKPVRL
ncbi:MAG TPA: hypothetical protein VHC49_07580 [Mycobacteriales bacterium]|nr:hypothetical protein [Mycobacteriales bacterium]